MRSRLIFAALFALVTLPLLLANANPVLLESLAVQGMLKDSPPGPEFSQLDLEWPLADDVDGSARRDAIRAGLALPAPAEGQADTAVTLLGEQTLRVLLPGTREGEATAQWRVTSLDERRLALNRVGAEPDEDSLNTAQLGSRWSLIPPLLAIMLAFLLRGTLLALSAGVLVGAAMIGAAKGNIFLMFQIAFVEILYHNILQDAFHLEILGFVILLSATVAVITRMGGVDGMVKILLRFAASSRSVQAVAYALGLGIFFDDYANTIIVGNSCGPLFDRKKVSRAKLAYIVDSTAAPIAGIAILSTWVAYQISTYAPQLPTVGIEASQGYALFLRTIPYRFYCMFAIFTVGMVIWMRRDFGPMRHAEEQARAGNDTSLAGKNAGPEALTEMKAGLPARWFNGVLPLGVMIFGTAALIIQFGASTLRSDAAAGDASAAQAIENGGFEWLRMALGASDSTAAIFYGSLAAFSLAIMLGLGQRLLSAGEMATTTTRGVKVLFKDAVLILLLAWSIGQVCTQLGTATYLVATFQELISGAWLPTILFLASCFVAFATGSSWTTMAIMQPNVVLLSYQLGEGTPYGQEGLLILSIGAVLEGAIFGDHCSPISDTTILSSAASKCNHIQHVRTQAPYAALTAFVAITIGYLPVALLNTPWWASLLLGMVILTAFIRMVGKPISTPDPRPASS